MYRIAKLVAGIGVAVLVGCSAEPDLVSSASDMAEPPGTFFNDSNPNPFVQADQSVPIENPEPLKGEIGFTLDLRDFAKLGHRPVLVELQPVGAFGGVFGGGPVTVPLGNGTYMGKYAKSLEFFRLADREDVQERLEAGIDFNVRIFGAESVNSEGEITGPPLFDQNQVNPLRSVVFSSKPNVVKVIVPNLPDLYTDLDLREDTYYYIEQVDLAGNPLGKGMYFDSNNNRYISKANIPLNAVPGDAETNKFLFRFYKWPGDIENRYVIQNVHTGKFVQDWDYHFDSSKDPHSVLINGNRWTVDAVSNGTWTGTHIFRFEKTGSGSYEMFSHRDRIRLAGTRLISSTYWPGNPTPAIQSRWRVVSTNIDWQVQTLKSDMLEPILGPPQVGIAYESIEINCGTEENVVVETGVERSATTTLSAEWQESLSTMSSSSHSLGWEVSLEVGGGFFGGPKYSGSLSGEHTWTTENSRTVTDTTGTESSETVTYSSAKTIQVEKGTGVRVKATYETYDDLQVTFAQRLLMRGVDKTTGLYLTGQEIKTQLLSTGFNGVIDEPQDGDDHVVVSLRSNANVSNLIKGYNTVTPVEANCEGESSAL